MFYIYVYKGVDQLPLQSITLSVIDWSGNWLTLLIKKLYIHNYIKHEKPLLNNGL